MQFNKSALNRSSLNVPSKSENQTISIEVYFRDSLKNTISAGIEINERIVVTERLNNTSNLTIALPASLELKEDLENDIHMTIKIDMKPKFSSNLEQKTYIAKEINDKEEFKSNMEVISRIGKDMYVSEILLEDNLSQKIDIGKEMFNNYYFVELLNVAIDATILDFETFTLDIELKPGETITLDSDLFTAYRGDENILYMHEGDWIYLDSESQRLELRAGSEGDIQSEIFYREGWL